MSRHEGSVFGLTPATNDDNWTLDAGTDEYGKIKSFSTWGEVTTGAVIQGRVARSGSAAGAGTPGNEQPLHPHGAASAIDFFTTYATTQPTLTAGALIPFGYNANGGGVYLIFPERDAPDIVGSETVSCRNDVGTSQSSYCVGWEEP